MGSSSSSKGATATSVQVPTKFFWCPDPVTIDKSSSWGPGNFQTASDGAFLKWDDKKGRISHLVQPNAEKTAPIGWVPTSDPTIFLKSPIGVITRVEPPSDNLDILTKDGPISYVVTEPVYVVCNLWASDNSFDPTDCWVMKVSEFDKNYSMNIG
jgi:hypothetical protein